MPRPKAKPRNHVRNRIKRSGNESLRSAVSRLIKEKDWLAPHLERWLANKR